MTQQEYEQKRAECWEEFKRTNLDGEVQWQPVNRYDVFCAAFDRAYALGKHENDTEGEEMLSVPRKAIIQAYEKSCTKRATQYDVGYADCLYNLFGSKGLPDAREVNFATKKPQPAEPKFKIGDELVWDKRILVKIDEVFADGKYLVSSRIGNRYMVKESDLEPYTEQREDLIPPNSGELESQEADKQFNTIIKDSFAKERRLNIAAQIVASMVGSDDWTTRRGGTNKEIWHNMAKSSLEIADALIAECEKKGGQDA